MIEEKKSMCVKCAWQMKKKKNVCIENEMEKALVMTCVSITLLFGNIHYAMQPAIVPNFRINTYGHGVRCTVQSTLIGSYQRAWVALSAAECLSFFVCSDSTDFTIRMCDSYRLLQYWIKRQAIFVELTAEYPCPLINWHTTMNDDWLFRSSRNLYILNAGELVYAWYAVEW